MYYRKLNDLEPTQLAQYAEQELREAINEEESALEAWREAWRSTVWDDEAQVSVVLAYNRHAETRRVTNMAETAYEDAKLLERRVLRWPGVAWAAERNAELKEKVVENLDAIHTHKMMVTGITSGMTSGNAHTAVTGTGDIASGVKLIKRRTRKNSKKTNKRKRGTKRSKRSI